MCLPLTILPKFMIDSFHLCLFVQLWSCQKIFFSSFSFINAVFGYNRPNPVCKNVLPHYFIIHSFKCFLASGQLAPLYLLLIFFFFFPYAFLFSFPSFSQVYRVRIRARTCTGFSALRPLLPHLACLFSGL